MDLASCSVPTHAASRLAPEDASFRTMPVVSGSRTAHPGTRPMTSIMAPDEPHRFRLYVGPGLQARPHSFRLQRTQSQGSPL